MLFCVTNNEERAIIRLVIIWMLVCYVMFLISDITIKFGTQKKKAHKFVLAARSSVWMELDLANMEELEISG